MEGTNIWGGNIWLGPGTGDGRHNPIEGYKSLMGPDTGVRGRKLLGVETVKARKGLAGTYNWSGNRCRGPVQEVEGTIQWMEIIGGGPVQGWEVEWTWVVVAESEGVTSGDFRRDRGTTILGWTWKILVHTGLRERLNTTMDTGIDFYLSICQWVKTWQN